MASDITVGFKHPDDLRVELFPVQTLANGVKRRILSITEVLDFGAIDYMPYEDYIPFRDGNYDLGGIWGDPREFALPIYSVCGSEAKVLDEIRVLDGIFRTLGGPSKVQIERKDESDDDVKSEISVRMIHRQAFRHSRVAGEGVINALERGQLIYIARFRAAYPHFVDQDASTGQLVYSGSPTGVWNNPSPNAVGLKCSLTGGGSNPTFVNNTTGRGFTITDTITGTVVVDWYGSDPGAPPDCYRGSAKLWDKISIAAWAELLPGDNSVALSATGAVTLDAEWRGVWDSP